MGLVLTCNVILFMEADPQIASNINTMSILVF